MLNSIVSTDRDTSNYRTMEYNDILVIRLHTRSFVAELTSTDSAYRIYHYEECVRLWELYQKKDLKNPAAVIDVNHRIKTRNIKNKNPYCK